MALHTLQQGINFSAKHVPNQINRHVQAHIQKVFKGSQYLPIDLAGKEVYIKHKNLFVINTDKRSEKRVIRLDMPSNILRTRDKGTETERDVPVNIRFAVALVLPFEGTKDELDQVELFPAFTSEFIKDINSKGIEAFWVKKGYFKKQINQLLKNLEDKTNAERIAAGLKPLKADWKNPASAREAIEFVDDLLTKYYRRLYRLIRTEEESHQRYLQDLRRTGTLSVAPSYLTMILEMLGIKDGLLRTFKDGKTVALILDAVYHLILEPGASLKDQYNDEYISYSDQSMSSMVHATIASRIEKAIRNALIQPKRVGAEGIYELFEDAIGYLARVQREGHVSVGKAMRDKLNETLKEKEAKLKSQSNSELYAQAMQMAPELLKVPPIPRRPGRGRPSAEEAVELERIRAQHAEEVARVKEHNKQRKKFIRDTYVQLQKEARLEIKLEIAEARSNYIQNLQDINIKELAYYGDETAAYNSVAKTTHTLCEWTADTDRELKPVKGEITIDATGIPSTAKGNTYVQNGPNSEHKTVIEQMMKLLVAFDNVTECPVVLEPLIGAESDSTTLQRIRDKIAELVTDTVLFLLDRGYVSKFNFHLLSSLGAKFLMMNKSFSQAEKEYAYQTYLELTGENRWFNYDAERGIFYKAVTKTAFELGICDNQGRLLDSSGKVQEFAAGNEEYNRLMNPHEELTLVYFINAREDVEKGEAKVFQLLDKAEDLNDKLQSKEETITNIKVPKGLKIDGDKIVLDPAEVPRLNAANVIHSFITNADLDYALDAFVKYAIRWGIELWNKTFKQLSPSEGLAKRNDSTVAVAICIQAIASTIVRYITSRLRLVRGFKLKVPKASEIRSTFKSVDDVLDSFKPQKIEFSNREVELSEGAEGSELKLKNKTRLDLARRLLGLPALTPAYVQRTIEYIQNYEEIERSEEIDYETLIDQVLNDDVDGDLPPDVS